MTRVDPRRYDILLSDLVWRSRLHRAEALRRRRERAEAILLLVLVTVLAILTRYL